MRCSRHGSRCHSDASGWAESSDRVDDAWRPIRIGRAWESQGYPRLDGWTRYRIEVDMPADWKERPIYVSFGGVDDYYELHINGKRAGYFVP